MTLKRCLCQSKSVNIFFLFQGPPGPQGVPGETGRHGEMGKEVRKQAMISLQVH